MKKVSIIAIFLLTPMSLMMGCQAENNDLHPKILQIASTKAELFGLPKEYRALHTHLESMFECRILFRAQPSGEAIAQQLTLGNIPFAILSAHEFASISDPSNLKLLATGLNRQGKPSHKAYIITRTDSHIKNISDCAGKRFAFGFYRDLLTDLAAQAALEKGGVSIKKLLPELLLPPPLSMEGRLYRGHSVALTILMDVTVNAGVVDELDYEKMPDTGGNFILGPSKDQLKIIGETISIPEIIVVAGPTADPKQIERLKEYLINEVKNEPRVCEQLGVKGFVEPDPSAYDPVRRLLSDQRSGKDGK